MAAGKGTRMKSAYPKVLHRVGGLPLIEYVLRTAEPLNASSTVLVVGHMADDVSAALVGRTNLQFAPQEPQLGTAHAVLQAEPFLVGKSGLVVLLSGDVPLLSTETLRRMIAVHVETGAAATLLTAVLDDPFGYGRVIRSEGKVERVVEERDATPEEKRIPEINAGIYIFDLEPLFPSLKAIAAANAQGEYYLTDLPQVYRQRGLPVQTLQVENPREILGINSRAQLTEVGAIMRQARNEELMAAGVTMEDPASTYVGPDVTVGPDTILHPNVHLEGRTRVGSGCEIHADVRIVDSTIGDRVTILNFCLIRQSTVAAGAIIGPFAHLRPESDVGEDAHVGNFVELKKTRLGRGSKANHLTYLGDATIGAKVNVGAGTITCNYDGRAKHRTVIEDGAFIGSDTQLIAPVTIGRDAYIGAGSSITEDVPPGALAVARGRQVNKEGWVGKKKKGPGA
ncbi:MAG TPA: bifunctional UDP-N-acetylglucosamine diphosphorylase/glucosamine-1-phosphate N-acetyltransferase GlmU [Vicinamibacterales bacterium]|nr:bifunctional UDP-N-acetylglucosamine diphosphorylase/glucosamine-1-phosphate N-acetyltransferase GlmU [Vicinamibacterales bacterium]